MLSPLAYGLLVLALLNCAPVSTATITTTTTIPTTSATTILSDDNIDTSGAINATAPNSIIAALTRRPQQQHDAVPPSISQTTNNTTKQHNSATEELPLAQPLVAAPEPDQPHQHTRLPEFPQRIDAVYFLVAVTGGAKIWSRTLARTLIDMGAPFGSPQGPPLRPLYVDIPTNGRFSVDVLNTLCQQSNGQPLAGVVVIGDGGSARAVAMSGSSMGLPVLWAKGGTANLDGMHREIPSLLQVMLQPSAKEILESVRALFLQTHWHSFFVLSDVGASMVLAGAEGGPLTEPPLVPTILPLSANSNDVFRQLAQISRSTRGVVLLLCDLESARRIMAEAQNLNMVGGHFIWVWADTSSTTEFFEAYGVSPTKATGSSDDTNGNGFVDRDIPVLLDLAKQSNGAARLAMGHVEGLLERKLEFEDRHPQRRPPQQPKRPRGGKSKENTSNGPGRAQSQPDRYIIGLNSEAEDLSEEFGPTLLRRTQEAVQMMRMHDRRSNEESNEHFFISNLNSDDAVPFAADDRTDEQMPPMADGDDSAGDLDGDIVERKPKRKTSSFMREFGRGTTADSRANATADSMTNSAQNHVLFHYFKDFPVGFLALRPIRMNVDRHFIRAAVRLFASTWAKVELESRERAMPSKYRPRTRPNPMRWTGNRRPERLRRDARRGDEPVNRNGQSAAEAAASTQPNIRISRSNEQPNQNTNSGLNENHQHLEQQLTSEQFTDKIPKSNIVGDYNEDYGDNVNDDDTDADPIRLLLGSVEKDYVNTATGKPSVLNKRHNAWPRPDIDIRHMRSAPRYLNGCYGHPTDEDRLNANHFARLLKENCQLAMSGQRTTEGYVEKSLTTHFELLNLVPDNQHHRPSKSFYNQQQFDGAHTFDTPNRASEATDGRGDQIPPTKWRRVGLVSGRNVHLDTIVWPGGDIVVSGLSARARSVFRVVTALAPPFVMESELDEDGLCLRGLPCHRLSTTGRHNLTLMFNAIETSDRLMEDAVEHGNVVPPQTEHTDEKVAHITKCCYGLSMDILDNVATELGFEFHLYIVRDELFGAKHQPLPTVPSNAAKDWSQSSGGGGGSERKNYDHKSQQQQQQQQQQHGQQQQKPSARVSRDDARHQWNGIMGDLVNGLADMSFAPLSVSKSRAEVIDFTAPYFHSGVSLLAAPKTESEIPLLAFLLPFSPELWIAIFTSLNITAVAVAVYEWLSPFGLNPWGRQRNRNFSMSSALWVMWGLLCGHLVAFKAPKSWPNKFLINVWGGFSVIFVASYTANIAALIAGLFFHNAANMHDTSLFRQRVGVPKYSAAESYVMMKEPHLWEHMKKYRLEHIEDGILRLKNRTLDLLMADAPVLDYYRATDHGCNLQRIGDLFVDDSYAIGMKKGFPLRDSISALIAKYASNGYLDILTEKWYGGLPCFKFEADIVQPRPLGVEAVAGVFLLLGMGMLLGLIILIFELWFYKFALPRLRMQPKDTIWKSRNIMFFSQKLYRFINCVELVSPHHAARELVHSIRQGQIASLFQKSIKRKEDEQRRRRKSKAQFFEMIQEIRRVQQVERDTTPKLAVVSEDCFDGTSDEPKSPSPPALPPHNRTLLHLPPVVAHHTDHQHSSGTNTLISTNSTASTIRAPKSSPRSGASRLFAGLLRDRSHSNSSALSIRRFSTDSIFGERMDTIGRRLSRDMSYSPPDMGASRRFETFGKAAAAECDAVTVATATSSTMMTTLDVVHMDPFGGGSKSSENITRTGPVASKYDDHRYDGHHTLSGAAVALALPDLPIKTKKLKTTRRPALNFEPYQRHASEALHPKADTTVAAVDSGAYVKPSYAAPTASAPTPAPPPRPSLEPPMYQVDHSKATLRARMHRELRDKYAQAPLQIVGVASGVDERTPVLPAVYRTQNNAERLARHQLLEAPLTHRAPVPSPRNSKRDSCTTDDMASHGGILKNSPVQPQPQPPPRPPKMSFDRLSREDLLRLSHSSQSEIHEYLNGSSGAQAKDQPPEPP